MGVVFRDVGFVRFHPIEIDDDGNEEEDDDDERGVHNTLVRRITSEDK